MRPLVLAVLALASVPRAFARAPEPASASWGVRRVNAPAAWSRTKGNAPICVVGSGVDPNAAGLRVDGGYNVRTKTEEYADDVGRGTKISGIIASVAPEARLYAVKAVDSWDTPGTLSPAAIAAGVLECVDRGLKLVHVVGINNRAAREDRAKTLERAIDAAYARGALVIAPASAGLFAHGAGLAYPARYAKVVAVSGSTSSDELLPEGNGSGERYGFFLGGGRSMSFIAPGSEVLTQEIGGRSVAISGSDAAAAYVTGLAALYLSLHPDAAPDEIKEALRRAATPLKGLPADQQGSGMIDAGKLVAARTE
ncbi:MAG: S8 family serine peptidase [Elusimicrobia bacterium]|nr:S8 family serine peptidase [Elusimicrobiota bacterium]